MADRPSDTCGEVTVEQRLTKYESVVIVLEALFDGVILNLVVQIHVPPIYQLVAVDAITLMHPQTN